MYNSLNRGKLNEGSLGLKRRKRVARSLSNKLQKAIPTLPHNYRHDSESPEYSKAKGNLKANFKKNRSVSKIKKGELNEGLGTKIIGGVAKRMITWPAAAIGGLVSGAKEVGANIKASKEKTVSKPTKGTIKPKKGKLAKPVPAEPEV